MTYWLSSIGSGQLDVHWEQLNAERFKENQFSLFLAYSGFVILHRTLSIYDSIFSRVQLET